MDGSPENVNQKLGNEHKVRNFFNNIAHPEDERFATIDTHAVAAAQIRPLGGGHDSVSDNFGATGGSAITGVSGTYPIYLEAYYRAAREVGILPREMQSITWEAVRGLFTDVYKRAEEGARKSQGASNVDAIWQRADAGEITPQQARSEIFRHAGGIRNPTWVDTVKGEAVADSTYKHERPSFRGSQVIFEVAPDPRNAEAKARWDALPSDIKSQISYKVAWDTAAKVLSSFRDETTKGELHEQLGGFGDDTNPSLSIRFHKNASANKIDEVARMLGYALNQQMMMRTSPRKFPGATEMGAVVVQLGKDATPDAVHEVYNEIRALTDSKGRPLVDGHTTADGAMVILNDGKRIDNQELANLIAEKLGDRFAVGADRVFADFPQKGRDSYGIRSKSQDTGGASLRKRSDQFRAEAAQHLERLLAEEESRGQAGAEGTGQEVSPSPRAGDGANTLEQSGVRGQIKFSDGTTVIGLFGNADKSTFQHETGHLFLQVVRDLAHRPEASATASQRWATLAAWLKVEGGELTRAQHEQFAEGWENYLAKGEAPTPQLRTVFQQFREWLLDVYQKLTKSDVEFSPAVKGEIDKMLGSQQRDPSPAKSSPADPALAAKAPQSRQGPGAGTKTPQSADPVIAEAQARIAANPDLVIQTGTDADGNPITKSLGDTLKEASDGVAMAKKEANLFMVAAQCLLGAM